MSEEITKGLFSKKIASIGYPQSQDTKENGVIWYKEDSYKKYNNDVTYLLKTASKKLNGNKGTPDFLITSDYHNIIIVVECKEDVNMHQSYDNLDNYKLGLGAKDDISKYCINGALHYAQYLNQNHDVISIAISGTSDTNCKVTSFVLPKNGELKDARLLEDGDYYNTIMSFNDYQLAIDNKLERNKEEADKVYKELSMYASACNNYLRVNGISAKDRAGFVSALVLALTNEESSLYLLTETSMRDYQNNIRQPFKDKLGKNSIELLRQSLVDIWDNKDSLPRVKRESLNQYYNRILKNSLLDSPESTNKFFKYGDTVLSSCIFSVYENIIIQWKNHTNLDIMGTFYTVFLKYAKGDAKDKGIVLTPTHITELFCDIAEHYLGKKLDNSTPVLDITTGTGGFLIGALNKMDTNIDNMFISEKEKKDRKKTVREQCLIGVEKEDEMFALAYANMRFHGDGKSNLYSCSSLLKHNAIIDKKGDKDITLKSELKKLKPMVGMINPPYSLKSDNKSKSKSKESNEKSTGQSELDFVYSMLSYLEKGGIGIAIIPISCAGNKGSKLRKLILKEHTLLACMSMPQKLFQNSDVATATCIMVFRAGVPHNESDKIVFLARWLDDGFVTVTRSGRYDKDGRWLATKSEWLNQLKGISAPKNTVYLRKKIEANDECLAEAYIETDYSKLSKVDFEKQLKKYSLFLYMEENEMEV